MFDKRLTLFFLLLLKQFFISSSQQNTDLSNGKSAYQSTDTSGGLFGPRLAVDGNTDMDFSSGSCSRTVASAEQSAYWYVDLGDTYSIDYVFVYPANQYEETLTGLEIRVVSDASTILTSTNICGSIPSSTTNVYYFVDCNPSLIGRYVSLYKSNINEIIVCEVDVYGVPLPDLTCPSDIMTSTQPSTTTVVTWDVPTIPDDPDLVISCNPPSGWSVTVGTTTVTCSATNYGDCTFTISVTENNPCDSSPCLNGGTCKDFGTAYTCACPTLYTGIRCQIGIGPCDNSPCVNGGTCTISGISYICTCPTIYTGARCETRIGACDSSPCLNGGTCNDFGTSYSCTCPTLYTGTRCETDGTPSVSCPNDITMDTNIGQTEVTWDDLSVSDNIDTGLSATCTPPSGSSFNAGSTDVTCTAMDTDNNTGECTFTVNINDVRSPTLTCPNNIEIHTSTDQATVTWNDPSVSDNVDTGLSATCTPSSGSSFNIGSTDVTCTAADNAGNTGSCGFTVFVIIDDSVRPVVTCPVHSSNQFTLFWKDPSVSDNGQNGLSATCTPPSGSSFDVGSTDVTCTATDIAGNTGSCAFKVSLGGLTILRRTRERMTPQR